jgi:hypothetical protein
MVDTNILLIATLEKAEYAFSVEVEGMVVKEVLNACIYALENGRAVELFLDSANQHFLEDNTFLHKKCIEFVQKGGRLYFVSLLATGCYWRCWIDFSEHHYFSLEHGKVFCETEAQMRTYEKAVAYFEKNRTDGKLYLDEPDDIKIKFSVSDTLVGLGDTVEISWEVERADKVVVQGLGPVEHFGRRRIRLDKNTVLKIGAYNERQARISASPVKVLDTLKIIYDLGFVSTHTGEYFSLVRSELYSHVYGVALGHPVCFSWKVPAAESVQVLPFGISAIEGEHTFIPRASQELEIHGSVHGEVFIRRIQLLVFPMPVLQDKLITPFKFAQTYQLHFSLPDPQAVQTLVKKEKKRYLQLTETIRHFVAGLCTEAPKSETLQQSLLNLLKTKNTHRPEIIHELKTIQTYYEQPRINTGK